MSKPIEASIVVVDDEPSIRELLVASLHFAGFEVNTAASGSEAIEVIERLQPDLIVPVPVHRSKERQRGFNQAAYLAEKLGHYTGISTDVNIVQKVLKTKSQKKLNALQRRKNLEKAFCVTGDVRGKNILVIDDVYTTGSTIDAMAGCLKRKGAGNVYFLTVCIGRR